MYKKCKGFTMIELIVVIAVLGILVTLAAISYKGMVGSAQDTAVKADVSSIESTAQVSQLSDNDSLVGQNVTSELTGETILSDTNGLVDVLSQIAAGKLFYDISSSASSYLKRTTKTTDNYLIDSDNNVYYKGKYSTQKKWEKKFKGGTAGYCVGRSIVVNEKGNYVLTGTVYNGTSFDVWVIEIDISGNKVWEKFFDAPLHEYDSGWEIVQTSDGGYVIAGQTENDTTGDAWVIKIDASGNEMWQKTFSGTGGNYDWVTSIIQTSDGGYAITGTENETSTYSTSNLWLIKTDSNGNEVYRRIFDGSSNHDEGFSIVQTDDGGFAIAGKTYNGSTNQEDVWLIITDSNGTIRWNRKFNAPSNRNDFATSITKADDGGFALACRTHNGTDTDIWVIKTKADGDKVWDKVLYETAGKHDYPLAIIKTIDGGYIVNGYARKKPADGTGVVMWVVKLSQSGNKIWDKTYVDTTGAYATDGHCIAQTPDNGYIMNGCWEKNDWSTNDLWIIKTDAKGNYE